MKADLPTREPERLKLWNESRLYEKIQDKNRDKPTFLLHDGPPYANGDIHMGHALNKVLKDFVVKYKTLTGFRSPYKPGWDCHGLPIEHQLFKQLGKNKHQVTRPELREKATEYALGWVEKQKEGFKRLGIFGDWDNPYLTLSKDYEASTVQAFYDLYEKGFVYRGLKPGYWCVFDETALAEAEVEYAEKKSDSVYVRFRSDRFWKAGESASILFSCHPDCFRSIYSYLDDHALDFAGQYRPRVPSGRKLCGAAREQRWIHRRRKIKRQSDPSF